MTREWFGSLPQILIHNLIPHSVLLYAFFLGFCVHSYDFLMHLLCIGVLRRRRRVFPSLKER